MSHIICDWPKTSYIFWLTSAFSLSWASLLFLHLNSYESAHLHAEKYVLLVCEWHVEMTILSCWAHTMLLVYIFLGLIIWHWTTNWGSFTWEDHISLSHLKSFGSSYFCRAEVSWAFPHSLWYIHWSFLICSHLRGHFGGTAIDFDTSHKCSLYPSSGSLEVKCFEI